LTYLNGYEGDRRLAILRKGGELTYATVQSSEAREIGVNGLGRISDIDVARRNLEGGAVLFAVAQSGLTYRIGQQPDGALQTMSPPAKLGPETSIAVADSQDSDSDLVYVFNARDSFSLWQLGASKQRKVATFLVFLNKGWLLVDPKLQRAGDPDGLYHFPDLLREPERIGFWEAVGDSNVMPPSPEDRPCYARAMLAALRAPGSASSGCAQEPRSISIFSPDVSNTAETRIYFWLDDQLAAMPSSKYVYHQEHLVDRPPRLVERSFCPGEESAGSCWQTILQSEHGENRVRVELKSASQVMAESDVKTFQSSASPPPAKLFTLWIAANEYQTPEGCTPLVNLRSPIRDSQEFEKRFPSKFQPVSTLSGFNTGIDSISKVATYRDQIWLIFAGHGDMQNSEYYFLTPTACPSFTIAHPTYTDTEAISGTKIIDGINKLPSSEILVTINTCSAGAAAPRLLQDIRDRFNSLHPPQGFLMLLATSENEATYEAGGHSYLFGSMNALLNNKKVKSARELFDDVKRSLSNATTNATSADAGYDIILPDDGTPALNVN
jgi:hypothetical protein